MVPVPQSCTSGRRRGVPHADKPLAVYDTTPTPPCSHRWLAGWISSGNGASRRRAFAAWRSIRQPAVYAIGILVPLVLLALVAAIGGESSRRVGKLPNGAFVEWIYPRSAIREVVAYAGAVLWLLRELCCRTPDEFGRTLWRAPVIVAIANFLVLAPFVLVHGGARELFAEQGGRIGLPFVVRILVGYGYVVLVERIQGQLQHDDA